jgi:hypothetical protein
LAESPSKPKSVGERERAREGERERESGHIKMIFVTSLTIICVYIWASSKLLMCVEEIISFSWLRVEEILSF